jgi:hypothetical protein
VKAMPAASQASGINLCSSVNISASSPCRRTLLKSGGAFEARSRRTDARAQREFRVRTAAGCACAGYRPLRGTERARRGRVQHVVKGDSLPGAPLGFSWRLIEDMTVGTDR